VYRFGGVLRRIDLDPEIIPVGARPSCPRSIATVATQIDTWASVGSPDLACQAQVSWHDKAGLHALAQRTILFLELRSDSDGKGSWVEASVVERCHLSWA
jgi:hypothetical protein